MLRSPGHHPVEQGPISVMSLGLGDTLGALADAVVVGAGRFGEARELVDKPASMSRRWRWDWARVLELALLVDEFRGGGRRRRSCAGRTAVDDLAQHLDLASEPAIVEHQFVDVAKQHAQQPQACRRGFQPRRASFRLVCEGAQARAPTQHQASGPRCDNSFGAHSGRSVAQRLFDPARRRLAEADGDELGGVDGGGVDVWNGSCRGLQRRGGAAGSGAGCSAGSV